MIKPLQAHNSIFMAGVYLPENNKNFLKRIYLEIIFFRFRKKRNHMRSFRVLLLSCVTKNIHRSFLPIIK